MITLLNAFAMSHWRNWARADPHDNSHRNFKRYMQAFKLVLNLASAYYRAK